MAWRQSFADWVNSPKVAGWFLVVVAATCMFFAIGTYSNTTALRDHGVRTQATVLEVHEGRDSYVVLSFTTENGQRVTARVGDYYWQPTPGVGDRPTIIYDPEQPDANIADTRIGPDYFDTWALGIGAMIAAALVWPTFTGRLDWRKFAGRGP